MRTALAIAKKEFNIYFTTPIAYVTFMVVAFFGAQFFNGGLDAFRFMSLRAIQFQQPQMLEHLNLTDMVVERLFGSIGIFIIITAPFLSMRLIAEEKRSNTFQLLMTSPVKPFEIVAGKYLAALGMIALIIALVAIFPVILSVVGQGSSESGGAIEWQTVATGLLGLFLLGAMAMSVGLFISSLTESVIVAALVTLIFLLTLWVVTIYAVGTTDGPAKELASALSTSEALGPFLQGKLELKPIVYFLSFITLGLFLTDRSIEGHRWS